MTKEREKGKSSKKKVESAAVKIFTNAGAVICYIGGALFFLFGIISLGILTLALAKGNISNSEILAVGGSGLFLILLGVAIIFLGRYFSKRN